LAEILTGPILLFACSNTGQNTIQLSSFWKPEQNKKFKNTLKNLLLISSSESFDLIKTKCYLSLQLCSIPAGVGSY